MAVVERGSERSSSQGSDKGEVKGRSINLLLFLQKQNLVNIAGERGTRRSEEARVSEKAVRRRSGGGSPGKWKWAKDGEAEEPVGGAGESEADRKGARRSEKAKAPEEGGLTRSSEARSL